MNRLRDALHDLADDLADERVDVTAHGMRDATQLARDAWSEGRRRHRRQHVTVGAAILAVAACCALMLGLTIGVPGVFDRPSVAVPAGTSEPTYPQRVGNPYPLRTVAPQGRRATAVVAVYTNVAQALIEGDMRTALLYPDGSIAAVDELASRASLSRDGSKVLLSPSVPGHHVRADPDPRERRGTPDYLVVDFRILDLVKGTERNVALHAAGGGQMIHAMTGSQEDSWWAPGSQDVATQVCRAQVTSDSASATCGAMPQAAVIGPDGQASVVDVGGYLVGWQNHSTLVSLTAPPWQLRADTAFDIRLVDRDDGRLRQSHRIRIPGTSDSVTTDVSVSPSGRLLAVSVTDVGGDGTGQRQTVYTVDLASGHVDTAGTLVRDPDGTSGVLWRGDEVLVGLSDRVVPLSDLGAPPIVAIDPLIDLRPQSWADDALSGSPVTHPLGTQAPGLLWRWKEIAALLAIVGGLVVVVRYRRDRVKRVAQGGPPAERRGPVRRVVRTAGVGAVTILALAVGAGWYASKPLPRPDGAPSPTYPERVESYFPLRFGPLAGGPATAYVIAPETFGDALGETGAHALLYPDGSFRKVSELTDFFATLSPDGTRILVAPLAQGFAFGEDPVGVPDQSVARFRVYDLVDGSYEEISVPAGDGQIIAAHWERSWAPDARRVAVEVKLHPSDAGRAPTPQDIPHLAAVIGPGAATSVVDIGGRLLGWRDETTVIATTSEGIARQRPFEIRLTDVTTGASRGSHRITLPGGPPPGESTLSVSPTGQTLAIALRPGTSADDTYVYVLDLHSGSVSFAGTITGDHRWGELLWRGDEILLYDHDSLVALDDPHGRPIMAIDPYVDVRSWAGDAFSGTPTVFRLDTSAPGIFWRWKTGATMLLIVGAGTAVARLRARRKQERADGA